MRAYSLRFAVLCLSLSLTSAFGLSGCDQIKRLVEKPIGCSDTDTLHALQNKFKADINAATKAYLSADSDIDRQTLKKLLSQLKIDFDQIQDQPNASYRCGARVNLTLPQSLLERANQTRTARGDDSVAEAAAAQDLQLTGIGLYQAIEYTPTASDNNKIHINLSNARNVQNFLASLLVDASQTPYDESAVYIDTDDHAPNTISDDVATSPNATGDYAHHADGDAMPDGQDDEYDETSTPAPTAPKKYGPAAASNTSVPETDDNAANQQIIAITRRANAEVAQKRQTFNQMWQSASPEAQASLTDDQKQWVKERDEQCASEAQQADAGYEEYTRLQCVGRMLDERYTQVKSYFEDYDH
ncbi:lysozyme inhibitor LprI family protein [Moraxella atlantae]|uniref:lysozyme inhibitor LprI family protein n=1 Tax=Faucicola atlantae TaxID=34059 RepID=UPI003751791A